MSPGVSDSATWITIRHLETGLFEAGNYLGLILNHLGCIWISTVYDNTTCVTLLQGIQKHSDYLGKVPMVGHFGRSCSDYWENRSSYHRVLRSIGNCCHHLVNSRTCYTLSNNIQS